MRSNSYCILLIALIEITSTLSEPRSSQSRSLIPNSRRSRQSTSSTPDPPDPAAASEETERSQLQNGHEDLSVSESQLNPVSLSIKMTVRIGPAEISNFSRLKLRTYIFWCEHKWYVIRRPFRFATKIWKLDIFQQ